MLNVNCTNLLM